MVAASLITICINPPFYWVSLLWLQQNLVLPRGKRVCGLKEIEEKDRLCKEVIFLETKRASVTALIWCCVFSGSFTSSPAYEQDSDLPLHGSLSSRTCSAPADCHLSPGTPLTVLPVVRKFSSNNFRSNLFMLQNISGLPFVTPPSLSASQHFLWALGRYCTHNLGEKPRSSEAAFGFCL